MRLTCREVRQMADALIDAAVLRVPAVIGASTPGAADVAAFHRRLNISTLTVRYSPRECSEAVVQYCRRYTAALGGGGLAVHSCYFLMLHGQPLQLPACTALLQVLPRLRTVCITSWKRGYTSRALAQALAAFETCRQLRTLAIAEMMDPSPRDDLPVIVHAALCKLRQLHTLRLPWCLSAAQLAALCAALPSLRVLGMHEFADALRSGQDVFPSIQALTAAPSVEDGIMDGLSMPPTSHRSLQDPGCWLTPLELAAFPSLVHMHQCTIYHDVGPGHASPEALAAITAAVQRFGGCTHAWLLRLALDALMSNALQQHLAAGSWQHLQHLEVSLSQADWAGSAGGPAGWLRNGLACLAAAAPNVVTVHLDKIATAPHYVLQACLPALLRLQRLHTLWVTVYELGPIGTSCLLMGLATGLACGRPDAPLRRVMLRGGDAEAFSYCDDALAALGLRVRVDAWVRADA